MYSLAFPVSIDTSIDVHVHDNSILWCTKVRR